MYFSKFSKKLNLFKDILFLNRKFFNKYFFPTPSKERDDFIINWISKLPPGSRLLDAGAGIQRYKKFANHIFYTSQDFGEYKGGEKFIGAKVDLWTSQNCDIISDITDIPVKDNSFDFIFSYKSLLYLDLEISFKELNRVLKKDGKLIILENISDNLIFKYYRFIKHKLQKKKFTKELNKIYTKDLNIFSKYFICVEKKYFDFFSVLGKIIADSIKIKFPNKFLFYLDNLFLNIFKIKFLSFTVVIVLEKK